MFKNFKKIAWMFAFALPFAASAQSMDIEMTVNAKKGVVLRKEANIKSERVDFVAGGERVMASEPVTKTKETLDVAAGYWRKCTYNGKVGYMFDAFLQSEAEPEIGEASENYPRFVTSRSGLIMRKSTSKQSEKIQTIPYGTELDYGKMSDQGIEETIDGVTGNWWKVTYKGKTGFVFGGFLSRQAPPALPKSK